MSLRDLTKKFSSSLLTVQSKRSIYFYSILIGIIAGTGAILFSYGLAWGEHLVLDLIVGWERSHPTGDVHVGGHNGGKLTLNYYFLFLAPIVGGLLVGVFVHFFGNEASGPGTDSMIDGFHYREGNINPHLTYLKSIATILTLSTGGSAGKEGPTALIGAGFGSFLSRVLKVGARARRTFLLAGTAGGLGAIFCAPFGGALTAVEIIYQEDFESDAFIPCIISSVTGYLVFTAVTGKSSIFFLKDELSFTLSNYPELMFYVGLGLLCFALGHSFIYIYGFTGKLFKKIKIHNILKPALGGVVVGLFALVLPQSIGTGFGLLQDLFRGEHPLGTDHLTVALMFLVIALSKLITTSATVASGGSGGLFGPSLFVGGMLGGCVGSLVAFFLPGWEVSIVSFIFVGMGSFFAGVARAPVSGMIMVSDMVGSYALLPPLMVVSVLSFVLSRGSIYKSQVPTRFQSPAHHWDMNLDILDRLLIGKDIGRYRHKAMVSSGLLLSQLEEKALDIQASDFIVVGPDESYRGLISLKRIRLTQDLSLIRNLVTLGDAVNSAIPYITPADSLGKALQMMIESEVDKLAVVEENKVLGYIRHTDIIKMYHSKVRRA